MAPPDNESKNTKQSQSKTGGGKAPSAPSNQTNTNGTGEQRTAFSNLKGNSDGNRPANLDFILDIPLDITVQLGRTKMLIQDLLKLGQGSVIELEKPAGDTLEILANHRLIAKGDVVVVNDKYGIRLTEVISPMERLEKLK
jgi:flagellar motor switch protein FliN/FliY